MIELYDFLDRLDPHMKLSSKKPKGKVHVYPSPWQYYYNFFGIPNPFAPSLDVTASG
jgi:hypothetical protein